MELCTSTALSHPLQNEEVKDEMQWLEKDTLVCNYMTVSTQDRVTTVNKDLEKDTLSLCVMTQL